MRRSELAIAGVITVIVSVSAAVFAAHAVASPRQVDSIESRSLTIVDKAGHPVIVLSSNNDNPEVALFDQQHQKRAALFLESNGTPDLYLYDAAAKARAALNLYDSGVPNLALFGASGGVDGPNIVLESTHEGEFRLAFHDFRKKRITATLEFRMAPTGPAVELMDDSGKTVWRSTSAQ